MPFPTTFTVPCTALAIRRRRHPPANRAVDGAAAVSRRRPGTGCGNIRDISAPSAAVWRTCRAACRATGEKFQEFQPRWQLYLEQARHQQSQGIFDPELMHLRWMLEEYRVSLFAQKLGTAIPVSPKRLEQQWAKLPLSC